MALKKNLTKLEHSKVWGKYNTHLKSLPEEEQKEHKDKNNWTMASRQLSSWSRTTSPSFFHFNESLASSSSLDKRERWQSHKQMLEKFGEEELEYHLNSGRMKAREDPLTYGIWQYKDHGDLEKRYRITKKNGWNMGQE